MWRIGGVTVREDLETKAARLLTSGRVRIRAVSPWHVDAVVRGDHGTYRCGYSRGRWQCECPCLTGCSHVRALRMTCDPVAAARPVRRVAS